MARYPVRSREVPTSARALLAAGLLLLTAFASAGQYGGPGAYGSQSYRVDVRMYGQGELNIKRWLKKYAGIDTDHYYLTGVLVHTDDHHSGYRDGYERSYGGGYGGHALLRVGSNYSPRIELRPGTTHIRAPRYDDGKWRLYVREGAQVSAVTLMVEPRVRHTYQRPYSDHHDDHGRYRDPWPSHGSPFDRRHRHDRYCRH